MIPLFLDSHSLFYFISQFDCTNTLQDQVLENVFVQVEPSEGFEVVCCTPCTKLLYNTPGITYTCVSIPSDPLVGKLVIIIF